MRRDALASSAASKAAKGLLLVLAAALVFVVPTASAAYKEVGSFGGGGSGPGGSGSKNGQLLDPGQADVSDASGLLYVVDLAEAGRVQAFEPTFSGARYAFRTQAPNQAPEGVLWVAVDKAEDHVYAASPAVANKFDGKLMRIDGDPNLSVRGPLAVDPTNGDLLVADRDANLIHRFEADGTAVGSFAAERPLDVAVNSSGEIFVVTSTGDLFDCSGTSSVQRFGADGTPAGTVGASLVSPGAVAVDPDNDQILIAANTNSYNFCIFAEPEVAVFDAAGNALQSIPLAGTQRATVSGLAVQGGESGRAYVVVKSPANDDAAKTKVIALEDDTPAAPVIGDQRATPGANGVELRAAINPRFAATQYHFEYGPTPAYGSSTPVESIPGTGEELSVAASIGGLQPDTVYHYRVVAENSVGDRTSPDRSFRTQAATGTDTCSNAELRALQSSIHLPDCRAYEMVSPAAKGPNSVLWGAGGLPPAGLNGTTADGEKVAFNSYPPFPLSEHGQPQHYHAARTATGWQSVPATPIPVTPNPDVLKKIYVLDATDDFSTSIYTTAENFDPLDQDGLLFPGFNFAMPDVYRWTVGGPTEWLSRPKADVAATAFKASEYAGRSADASTVYFQTSESLTPDAGPIGEPARYLYAHGPDGTELINTDESGNLLGTCGATLGDLRAGGVSTRNAVSADGTRAFFQIPDAEARLLGAADPSCYEPTQVYLRDGDTVTNVSASQMTAPDPIASDAVYQGATTSGSRVFFTSGDRLTDDATVGGGLYRYDVESEDLSFLSTGAEGPGGAEVEGVVKSTDDGSHVYFLAKGQLDGSEGTAGASNLYLWTPGAVRFIATVTASDAALISVEEQRPARTSDDGSYLLFLSRAQLTDHETDGTKQAYLWSEDTGKVLCASCDPAGSSPGGSVTLRVSAGEPPKPSGYSHDSRNLLDDGTVFFESADPLVKGDINGSPDVYGYRPGGVPRLISDGKAKYGSSFFDASADGRNVFFATQGGLVPEDVDNGENDIYDARVGGGFYPVPAPRRCTGEACQGPSSSAPTAADVGSAGVSGSGSKADRARSLRLLSKRVSGSTVVVKARVGGSGTLSADGAGLSGARRSVKRAGAYSLRLSLDRAAKARLVAKGELLVSVNVRFAPAAKGANTRSTGAGSALTRSTVVRFVAGCGKKCTNADRRAQG